jgi:RHS repeat-associated protein
VALRSGGTLYWLLSDHLGSTAVTLSGTTEAGEVRYRAFGATRFTSGTTPTSYRFTGQREEAALGLYFYNARWYDPVLGHFLSPDTLVPDPGNALDYHRYAYVRFNPLKYTDPTGHCPICISIAVGTVIDVATDFFIAQATGTEFDVVESLMVNGATNLVTAGFGGKLAKLRHLGKVAGLVDNVASHGDEAARLPGRITTRAVGRSTTLCPGSRPES